MASRAGLWILCSVVVLFLVAPVLIVVPLSLSTSQFLEFPPPGYSFHWFSVFIHDSTWMNAVYLSLRVALGATALALVIGTAAAYAIVRGGGRFRAVIEPVLVLPMIVPIIVYAIGAYLIALPLGLVGQTWLLIVAHALLVLPYVFLNVGAGLRVTDHRLELVAQSLGASRPRAFRRVILPLIAPAVTGAALLAFALSIDETVVALFLTSDTAPTLPVKMYGSVLYQLNPLVPVAATVVLTATILIGLVYLLSRRVAMRGWRAIPVHDSFEGEPALDD
jgi:ABC-type spermidine/putrescine transport system permease subunit II